MKNIEKYTHEIINILDTNKICDFLRKNKIVDCLTTTCKYCYPRDKIREWFNAEYKEPEIDWAIVPIDTPVFTNNGNDRGHFAGLVGKYPSIFESGTTSWSTTTRPISISNIQLTNDKDIEKYRKR